jgi:hypothetical protein
MITQGTNMKQPRPNRHEQTAAAPNILIHPIDSPAGRVTEERPSRVPTFSIDVLAPTAVFAVIVFTGCYSMYVDFWPGTVTSGFTLAFFLVRVRWVFDSPLPFFKETEFQDVRPRMAPPLRTVPVTSGRNQADVPLRYPKTIRGKLGSIELSGRQLDKLLLIVNDPDGDGRYRRETSGLGRGVMDAGITTAQDPILKAALIENGYIDDEQYWTNEGRQWLTE